MTIDEFIDKLVAKGYKWEKQKSKGEGFKHMCAIRTMSMAEDDNMPCCPILALYCSEHERVEPIEDTDDDEVKRITNENYMNVGGRLGLSLADAMAIAYAADYIQIPAGAAFNLRDENITPEVVIEIRRKLIQRLGLEEDNVA